MDPQKFGDSYDFVKSVPRQSVLPACRLIEKCYRDFSTWGAMPQRENSPSKCGNPSSKPSASS